MNAYDDINKVKFQLSKFFFTNEFVLKQGSAIFAKNKGLLSELRLTRHRDEEGKHSIFTE